MTETRLIKIRIFRFDPTADKEPRYETYEIPFFEGMRILDTLDYIREELGVDVAYRSSCQYRRCGVCGILVNGEPKLACYEPAEDDMKLEPLPNFPLIRDLVVDRSAYDLRMLETQPFLNRAKPIEIPEKIKPDKNVLQMTKLTECLECLLCISACPLSKAASREFAGPAALVQVAKFMIDPRDDIKDERLRKIRDELWLCANCNSCNNCCPTSLPVLQGINDLCSRAVETGFIPRTLQAALTSIYKNANPWRGVKDRRDQWADGLKIKRFPKNKTKLLYFVGCTPSYDTRAQQVARSMVTILDEAGVDFGILGNEENCCGSPVARIGDLGLQELLVEQNIKIFDKYEIEKIVTTCPHCYDTLANDYKKYGGRFEVQHYTQFIGDLIDQNRLVIQRKIEKKVTYHDPCFLAKHNNITESPRKILENIQGLTLVEMPRNRKNSFCCGGGGGRMWVTDTTEENLNITRSKEAASISPNMVVATCQFCLINLTDGIKAIDKDKEIQVLDLAELLKDVCIRGNR